MIPAKSGASRSASRDPGGIASTKRPARDAWRAPRRAFRWRGSSRLNPTSSVTASLPHSVVWKPASTAAYSAHFLMKLMFCMFAEDIELLPGKLFERTLTQSRCDPAGLSRRLGNLFKAMAKGGEFGAPTSSVISMAAFSPTPMLST